MILMRALLFLAFCLFSTFSFSQEQVELLLKQADNFDKQVKETEAIEKYKEVLESDPKNFKALYRLTELNAAIGSRQIKNEVKLPYFTTAMDYAGRAFTVDSTNADSYYLLSLASWKMSTVEEKNKEEVEYIRKWREYADKAVAIDPKHAKATFLLGKWNFDMAKASFLKKAAAKTIYGGMTKWDIESATRLFEKAKLLDPYFVQNYYELAKAYEYNNQPTPQIETLNRLVKLPVRTGDDAAWKAEGKKMLEQMK
jgi:tetratricopeptide (TPR) repeat protein